MSEPQKWKVRRPILEELTQRAPVRRPIRRPLFKLSFREQLALVLLGGVLLLYAVVIFVGLFFIRTMDDVIKLLSEVAKVLGPIAGVIVAFYYERQR